MRINTYKNYIGLCACKGCFKPFKVLIMKQTQTSDTIAVQEQFRICQGCVEKLFAPDFTEEGS